MLGAKVLARSKLNLFLEVGPLREDGYHQIRSVMQALELADELYLRRTDGSSGKIRIRCSDRRLPVDEENFVWRAVEVFDKRTGALEGGGIEIFINKRIPIGAGLAGGSADAAATLVALAHIYELDLDAQELLNMASLVGSDVPFCLVGGTAMVTGRGEKVEALEPLPPYYVVLATTGIESSTPEVYRRFDSLDPGELPDPDNISQRLDRLMEGIRFQELDLICANLHNSLEAAALDAARVNKYKVLAREAGAAGALMTGSGPTVFALASSLDSAVNIARNLEDSAPITIITSFAGKGAEITV